MDNVGLNTARPQPARQPEPVASGLVGDDNALDLATRLARFGAPTIQKLQQCFLVCLELLERLAFDPRNNRRDEPLRLAHLDHGDDCVILLEGGEGLARIKRLRHGVLRRFVEQRRRCHTLAACPIASSSLHLSYSYASPYGRAILVTHGHERTCRYWGSTVVGGRIGSRKPPMVRLTRLT